MDSAPWRRRILPPLSCQATGSGRRLPPTIPVRLEECSSDHRTTAKRFSPRYRWTPTARSRLINVVAVNAARCGERVVGAGGAPVAGWSTKAIPGSPPRGELRPPVCRQRPLLHPWRHGALALMRCQGWYSGAIKTRSRRSQPARRRPGSRPTNANGRKMRDQRPVEVFCTGLSRQISPAAGRQAHHSQNALEQFAEEPHSQPAG
jgi:hypothetical protein